MRKDAIIWHALVVMLVSTALALLIFFTIGFERARAWVDVLARDGSADSFTPAIYLNLSPVGLIFGSILLILSAAMLIWKSRSILFVAAVTGVFERYMSRFAADTRQFTRDFRSIQFTRQEILMLSGIILLAMIARLFFLMQPFKHDEAYTVAVFANQPLRIALSDYHLPNNHLFHTFLVHLVYSIFGYVQWAVRLPSFIAGVLTVPALYLLSRTLHGRTVAFIAATAAAVMPVLVDFSTQSRGYTLLMLFSLLLFLLGIYIRQRPNQLAWLLIVIVVVLGIYTIPIFYFSYLSFLLWLGLAFLIGDLNFQAYGSRWKFIGWGFLSGMLTVLFTILLYIPPVLRSGLQNVLPYQVSDPLSYNLFLQEVSVRLTEFAELVLLDLPFWLGWVLAVGIFLSLLLPARSGPDTPEIPVRVPLQLAVMVGTFGLIFALRAPPWARFLTFLVPLGLMWAAAGWVGLFRRFQQFLPLSWKLEHALAVLVLVAAVGGTLVRVSNHRSAGFDVVGNEESIARYLQSDLRAGDMIVIPDPQDAAVWYYWRLYGFDPGYFEAGRPIDRVFVVIDPNQQQTLEAAMDYRGPHQYTFNRSTAVEVYQAGNLRVFEWFPDP
jgi:hypothetical protein